MKTKTVKTRTLRIVPILDEDFDLDGGMDLKSFLAGLSRRDAPCEDDCEDAVRGLDICPEETYSEEPSPVKFYTTDFLKISDKTRIAL